MFPSVTSYVIVFFQIVVILNIVFSANHKSKIILRSRYVSDLNENKAGFFDDIEQEILLKIINNTYQHDDPEK